MFEINEFLYREKVKTILSDNNEHSLNEIFDQLKFCLIERDFTRDIIYEKKLAPMPGIYGTSGPGLKNVYDFYYPINNFEQIAHARLNIRLFDGAIALEMDNMHNKDMDNMIFKKYVGSIENYITGINKSLEKDNNIIKDIIIDTIESLEHKLSKDNQDSEYDYNDENNVGISPNDQRSDVYNPNNPDYKEAMDNRSNQLNPNNPAYRSSRGRR